MPKAKRVGHQKFEGDNAFGTYVKITHEMMNSPAWQDLNTRQWGLYLAIKSKYRQKVVHGRVENSNRDDISYTKAEAMKHYGDYRTFQADMESLKEHGFIRLISSGYRLRTCNIYGFDDGWLCWGQEKNHPRSKPPDSPVKDSPGTHGTLYKGGGLSHHESNDAAE